MLLLVSAVVQEQGGLEAVDHEFRLLLRANHRDRHQGPGHRPRRGADREAPSALNLQDEHEHRLKVLLAGRRARAELQERHHGGLDFGRQGRHCEEDLQKQRSGEPRKRRRNS